MKIIFLGPPGVGKGTVAKRVLKDLNAIQISTGDLLRDAIKNKTSLGIEAQKYMDKGDLVPDNIIIKLIKEKIKNEKSKNNNSFILDGIPRTISQAEELDKVISIDKVVLFEAPKEVIIQRLSGRRICPKCGQIYHMKNLPPKIDGICDKCKVELIQREDDKPEAIENRLKVYDEKTAPLIEYYNKNKKLIKIDAGNRDLDLIVADTINVLNKYNNKKEE